MSDEDRKTEPPLHLDMPFAEALERFVRTDPAEVEPPRGKKAKVAKSTKRLATTAKARPPPQKPAD